MDSQRNSTGVHQRQIPLLAEARTPELVDPALIERLDSEDEAILLCVHLSRLSHEAVCSRLGIDKGHWSRILQGRAHFPTRKRLSLMQLCGNLAPIQYEALRSGLSLYESPRAKRKAELLQELERLEAA